MRRSDALELCRATRPELPADLLSPHGPAARALLEEILAMPVDTPLTETEPAPPPPSPSPVPPPRRLRLRPAVVIAAAAVVAAVAAVGALGTGAPRPALADIARVAETSNAALAGTGRAHVAFDLQAGTPLAQQGTSEVAWSGSDIEMKVHIEAQGERPASDSWTKVVGGERYALVGPKGQPGHWVHRTGAGGPPGGALFDADPRTLLAILDPAARFAEVGTDRVGGVETRHLRATEVDELPVVDLGLAPDTRNTSVTSLDLWVGADDVVRRLDFGLRRTDTKTGPGGQPLAGVTFDSTYSVTFSDLGAPITITPPADVQPDAGKG
jgi:hypothetical protein